MVKLRAFKAYEGAGVIEIDHGKLVYIDFPYSKENEYECSPEQLERLVLRMDFEPTELEFSDGAAAVAFLRAKGNEGEDPFASESEDVILERFNSIGLENLEGIVDSIQEMYVETKKYDQAILALERIGSLRVVVENTELSQKVDRMLLYCFKEVYESYDFKRNTRHDVLKQQKVSSHNVDARFPLLVLSFLGNLPSVQSSNNFVQ